MHKMMYKVHASVPEEYRENLWGNVRAVINPMLNTKRNNTNNELKRKVMGKWSEGGGALSLGLSQLNEKPLFGTRSVYYHSILPPPPQKVSSNDSVCQTPS